MASAPGKAQRRWANPEALAHFEAALASLASLPDTEQSPATDRRHREQAEVKFAGRHAEHIAALEGIRDSWRRSRTARARRRGTAAGFLTASRESAGGAHLLCRRALEIAEPATSRIQRVRAVLAHSRERGGGRSARRGGGRQRALPLFERQGNLWWRAGRCGAQHGLQRHRGGAQHGVLSQGPGVWANDDDCGSKSWLFRTGSTHILGRPRRG